MLCAWHQVLSGIAFVHILYGTVACLFYAEFLLMCFFLFMFQFHNQKKKAKKVNITSQRMDHTELIIIGTIRYIVVVAVVVVIMQYEKRKRRIRS